MTIDLLVVVAHPDDETFGCGSLLLAAADAGWSTAVLCATRGEAGEATDGTPADRLAEVREHETRAAAAALGVASVDFLDLHDSGMSGDAAPDTLVGADPDVVTAAVRDHLERLTPTTVVTLDASDGHRDHARIRDTTLAAVESAEHQVARVYLHCLPQVLMRRWFEHMAAHDPSWEHLLGDVPGTPADEITTTLDTSHLLARRDAAMALHHSQRSPFDGLPDDLRHAFLTTEHLRRLRPAWAGGALEHQLSDLITTTHEHGAAMHTLHAPHTLPTWVHRPGTPEYDTAVAPWNIAVAPRPLGVVEATSSQDVVDAVRLARSLGVTVAVQSTGHGITSDLSGSLLVSTRAMTGLTIDPARRLATAGAGVRWSQVLDAGAPLGLAGLAGSAPHVGVVGYTTGGGLGPLARTHGLASDRVRAVEVVTGDGELCRATETEHPDLFWALRGGRGVLGIVTSIEFELLPIAEIYGGALYLDGADAEQVLHRWATWSPELPPEVTTSVALLQLPPLPSVPPPLAGRLTVAVRFASTQDAAQAAETLAPMREVAPLLVDTVATMPYAALGSIHADPVDPMPFRDDHVLLGGLPTEAVDALLDAAGPGSPPVPGVVELRQLGGAVAASPRVPSAFSARHAGFALTTVGPLAPPVADVVVDRAERVLRATRPWQVPGGLPTFAARDGAAWLRSTYDAPTLRRLAEVSATYDPAATILGAGDLRG